MHFFLILYLTAVVLRQRTAIADSARNTEGTRWAWILYFQKIKNVPGKKIWFVMLEVILKMSYDCTEKWLGSKIENALKFPSASILFSENVRWWSGWEGRRDAGSTWWLWMWAVAEAVGLKYLETGNEPVFLRNFKNPEKISDSTRSDLRFSK